MWLAGGGVVVYGVCVPCRLEVPTYTIDTYSATPQPCNEYRILVTLVRSI
jgi:hypothetical protein